jgi:hypothetical protein
MWKLIKESQFTMKTMFFVVTILLAFSASAAFAADPVSTPIAGQADSCTRAAEQALAITVTDALPAGSFLQELTVSAGSAGQVYYGANVITGPVTGDSVVQARITSAYGLEAETPIRVTLTTYAGERRTDRVTAARTLVFDCTTGAIEEASDAPFADGRINQHQEASAAVYCGNNGAINIFSIDARGRGEDLFTTTSRELSRVPANPEINTLVEQVTGPRGPIQLWRLNGGLLQIVSPGQAGDNEKNYEFIFSGCSGQNFRG